MNHRRAAALAAALPLLLSSTGLLSGCSSTGNAIAQRAFVEAVNLHCRSTKARIEIAGKIATVAARTDQGKQLTSDAQARIDAAKGRAQDLIDRVGAIAGPTGLRDDLVAGFKKLQEIPTQVSDGALTKEEGLRQIEKTRADLRAKGFVDCV